MGAKSRKSFRYDQRALAEQGEVEFECWETFEDVRAMMPATCVVEVESKKERKVPGFTRFVGSVPFLRITPRTCQNREVAFDHFTSMRRRLPGSWIFWERTMSRFTIYLLMKNGRSIPRVDSYSVTTSK